MQHCTVQYRAVQCSAVQCTAVQCGAMQCSVLQCIAVQCTTVQCSAVYYSTLLFTFEFRSMQHCRVQLSLATGPQSPVSVLSPAVGSFLPDIPDILTRHSHQTFLPNFHQTSRPRDFQQSCTFLLLLPSVSPKIPHHLHLGMRLGDTLIGLRYKSPG